MGNKSSPYVLRSLCILGPEEILKLAHMLHRQEVSFKKASGDDLIVWKPERAKASKKNDPPKISEGRILPFTRPASLPETHLDQQPENGQEPQILASEQVLLQREIARQSGSEGKKAAASRGYQAASEMYVVKSQTLDGKEKIRYASTNGVLINKKQA